MPSPERPYFFNFSALPERMVARWKRLSTPAKSLIIGGAVGAITFGLPGLVLGAWGGVTIGNNLEGKK